MREPTDAEIYTAVEADLRALLKGKHSSLTLSFNDHAVAYQTAEEAERSGCDFFDWTSDEEHARAIALNSVWTLQWYPETPVGFHAWSASSLAAVLASARSDKPDAPEGQAVINSAGAAKD